MSKDEWKKLNKNEWKKWVAVVGRMLLAYALVFAQGAWATQNQGTKDKPASPQKAAAQQAQEKQSALATTPVAQTKQAQGEESASAVAEEKPSRDGSHQGIKVHGHWTIEVKNPDGTLVRHMEFENSLVPTPMLSLILSRTNSVGPWYVNLSGTACSGGSGASQIGSNCVIFESGPVFFPDQQFKTLSTASVGNNLVLSGTMIAPSTGNIASVSTWNNVCPPTTAPSSCPGNGTYYFTQAAVPPTPSGLAAVAGQTIAVTVTVSFS